VNDGGVLRIGSDDAKNPARFLEGEGKLGQQEGASSCDGR
jgi:hypothetical protein